MLIIAGIIPIPDIPLLTGFADQEQDSIVVSGYTIPCGQGTAAMISAALAVTDHLDIDPPQVVLAGDTGSGDGSQKVYQYLIDNVERLQPKVLALHYWMPNLELMHSLYEKIEKCKLRPILIADAASMYTAKATGLAPGFDLFTPDCSEMAFLADPEAFHPAYIDKHLFELDEDRIPELIELAYKYKGAARILLVKGKQDIITDGSSILSRIDSPDVPAMECIGGTGDTITGMCAALADSGMAVEKAAVISARVNRIAGSLAAVNPASSINKVITQIPAALAQVQDVKQ